MTSTFLKPVSEGQSRTGTHAVELHSVSKVYGSGERRIIALDEATVEFRTGTFTAIMGPSGSGKSTLLQCAAGLDVPTCGEVFVGGIDIVGMDERERTRLRRQRIGFVFQAFNLVASLTAAQNVELPSRLSGKRPDRDAVRAALAEVGLADRAAHRPAELSGGQQQRVALARALITHPDVLFADEPTGSLDTNTSREVLNLLRDIVDRHQQTVVMVTHDPIAAAVADRVLFLKDGRIDDELVTGPDGRRPTANEIAARMTELER